MMASTVKNGIACLRKGNRRRRRQDSVGEVHQLQCEKTKTNLTKNQPVAVPPDASQERRTLTMIPEISAYQRSPAPCYPYEYRHYRTIP